VTAGPARGNSLGAYGATVLEREPGGGRRPLRRVPRRRHRRLRAHRLDLAASDRLRRPRSRSRPPSLRPPPRGHEHPAERERALQRRDGVRTLTSQNRGVTTTNVARRRDELPKTRWPGGDRPMSQTFQGSLVAMVTPFRNGKVDDAKVRELVDFHVTHG